MKQMKLWLEGNVFKGFWKREGQSDPLEDMRLLPAGLFECQILCNSQMEQEFILYNFKYGLAVTN